MSIASIASCACSRVCASTTATASPTKRTVSTASACRGGDASGLPSGRLKSAEFGSGLTPALTKSCPVTTPVTPGIVSAAALLIAAIRACGCGERRKHANTWPGAETSSAKRPLPTRRSASSTRRTGLPLPKRLYCGVFVTSSIRHSIDVSRERRAVQDRGRNFLDRLRRRIDHRNAFAVHQLFGLAHFVAAIVERCVGAAATALLTDFVQPIRCDREPEKLFLERQHGRSEEHTSELQSRFDLVCRLLLEKKKKYACDSLHTDKKNKSNITII